MIFLSGSNIQSLQGVVVGLTNYCCGMIPLNHRHIGSKQQSSASPDKHSIPKNLDLAHFYRLLVPLKLVA
jgi:hypothetical protein